MTDESRGVDNESGFDRRRLLKGAAAAGVGVAAWAAPSITSLGGTPAYASMCTSGSTSYSLGQRNTNCNCNPSAGSPPGKVVRYKELGSACFAGPVFPGSAVMKEGSCAGVNLTDAGTCPPGYETASGDPGGAGICVSPTSSTLYCRTEVRVYQGGSCGGPYTSYFGAIVQGAGFLPAPPVPCAGGGNIFIEVFATCSEEFECL